MNSVHQSNGHYHPAEAGIAGLAAYLARDGYHGEAIARICEHTRREQTPTGAPDLDPRDEEWAEWSYVESCVPVASVDPAWDEFYCDPAQGPVYNTRSADYCMDRLDYRIAQLMAEEPPPIRGGAPTAEETVETLRRWYRTRPSFGDWLQEQGGIAREE